MIELDTFQRLTLAKAARRGIVYYMDTETLHVRHYKDSQGLSYIVVSDNNAELARMPLDTWQEYCQSMAQMMTDSALEAAKCRLVSDMSAKERALYISSHSAFYAEIAGVSKRDARRRAVKALKELDALQAYGKSLTSKEAPKRQDKPRPQITHVKSKAASASSRVLFAQKMESQGKGRAILAKRSESAAPCVKIRRK